MGRASILASFANRRPLHNAQCTMHNAQCTMHNAQYIMHKCKFLPCTMHRPPTKKDKSVEACRASKISQVSQQLKNSLFKIKILP